MRGDYDCRGMVLWVPILALLAVTLFGPAVSQAESDPPRAAGHLIHRSPPPPGAKTHTVVPGERFRAGWFKSWFLGKDYRDLWTMPIEIPVLDLDEVGGGLTPLRTGGFGQSIALHFTGNDGRRYTVRSLDKDPTRRIDKALKETFVEDILQDGISALLPAAGLVADPLMEAAGILHSKHTLVVIPDDPRLGEYREEFAGLIGTLQLHPSEGPDDTPGFAGSTKISGSETVWERLEKSPKERIDSRAFLKARMMDFLLNDKDRHPGQWRWARFPQGAGYIWTPIPEDRDQAFIDLDGFSMFVARRALPTQIKFEKDLPNILGLSMSGWEIDRQVLADLDRSVWDEVAAELQAELTDAVIEQAALRLPKPYYEKVGEELTESLKSRRDQIAEYAGKYYEIISKEVEIWGTDKGEVAELEHLENGDLAVRIGLKKGSAAPYYQRTFRADETNEVRLYLRGGKDETTMSGGKGKITVRVDGGGGDDSYANESRAGDGRMRIYDSRGDNAFPEGEAKVDESPFEHPHAKIINHVRAQDWGKRAVSFPVVYASPDLGLYAGFMSGREHYGYRKFPFSSRHEISLGLASKGPEPFIGYTGTFRHLWPGVDGILHLEYSGINVIRFHGLGNESEIPGETDFYEVEQTESIFAPSLAFRAGGNRAGKPGGGAETLRSTFTLAIGPIVKYADTPESDNDDKFIGSFAEPVYGTGEFGQVGVQASIDYDTRDNAGYAKRGIRLQTAGAAYPGAWDVATPFQQVSGSASTYLTARIPLEPTLALRAGGKKVWGAYPFHEAAFVGGPKNVRGFRQDRFGGDAAAYGNAELRFELFDVKILLPGKLGLFAAVDAGRVFLDADPDDADEWHTAMGGGIWLSFLDRLQTLSIAIMDGDDLTGVYFGAGFMY